MILSLLSSSDRSFLYTYLAHTIEAGVHPKEALAAYISDVSLSKKHKEVLGRSLLLFTKKSSFGAALFAERVIPEDEARILVFAQKQSALYAPAFEALGAHLRRCAITAKKVRSLFVYPTILTGELVILGLIIVFWLIPQLDVLFVKLGVMEPGVMRWLARAGETVEGFLVPSNASFAFVIPAIVFAFISASRHTRFRRVISAIILRAPFVGPFYRLFIVEKIFGILAIIVKNMPRPEPKEAFMLVAECTNSPLYKKMFADLARALQEQTPIARALQQRKNQLLLPVIARRMLILGEKRGDISAAIVGIVRILSEELDIELSRFSSLLEPIFVVFVAAIVGGIGFMIQRIFFVMQGAF